MTDPRFTPTDTGFRDAVGRYRRRRHRRRTAAASAAGTTLAAAVAVLALGGTPLATDSLRQNQPAAPPPVGPPQATPRTPPTQDGATPGPRPPRAVGEPAPAISPRTATAPTQAPDGGPDRAETTAGPGTIPARPPVISSPVTLTAADYRSSQPCADTTGRAAAGWCLQPGDDFDGTGGQPTALAVSLCRLPGFPAASAQFPSTAEAGFALYDERGQRRLWDHASQHPGTPREHARVVDPGRCLVWTTSWNNRDNTAAALAPGAYELRLAVRADNIDGANRAVTQTYRYTVHEN